MARAKSADIPPVLSYAGRVDQHAIRVLEYQRVLDLIAAETAFSIGTEYVRALEPAASFGEVHRRLAFTAEAMLLDQMGVDIPFGGARDIRPAIVAASKEQTLTPAELVETAYCLKTTVRARRTLERINERVPGLFRIAERIAEFHAFLDAVDECIDERGEVADGASEALGRIRRELRVARQRLEQRAQAALADAVRRGLAQEALLTERNGRLVIPVRAEQRGQFPGIVHDVSSSGATVFVEPMGVVEAGNEVRELELAEEREIRRILRDLADLLAARADDATLAVEALGELDLYTALARFGRRMRAQLPGPGDTLTWLTEDGSTTLRAARHPLLTGEVVPIDLSIGGSTLAILITGPNTGGKTVALKTLGLLTLMVQSGIPVPCEVGSTFAVAENVLADIGDEQSIQQSLSTFSAHMKNIIAILEAAGPTTLVLLDELGAGTDPTEGASLARAILETLLERGCRVVATTHHGELKAFAHEHPQIENASVEFDLETLSPTYHLTVGLPGQSNALAIARRLGLGEDVVERAERRLGEGHFELEGMLDEIRRERAAAGDARRGEVLARQEAEEIRADLARRRDQIESERVEILERATRDAEDYLAKVRSELDRLKRREARTPATADAEETLATLDRELARLKVAARPQRAAHAERLQLQAISPGARIHVRDIPQAGEALGEVGEDGRVEAQFGALRMKVSIDRIERVEPPAAAAPLRSPPPAAVHVPSELDLRGMRADEALERCDAYLDDAYSAGLPFVRIIHGRGTGALRAVIRESLANHPLVRRYESGPADAGGDGVTIATLVGA